MITKVQPKHLLALALLAKVLLIRKKRALRRN